MSKPKIALNINFDSLSDCMKLAGCPPISTSNYKDPCFFAVMDRFLNICAEYNAPLTLFMVGQDLEYGHHAEQVARWKSMGHEIANHSYSHRHDLCVLPQNQVQEEIERSHEIIKRIIGEAPTGFTSPGWHSSQTISNTLTKLGYSYDASLGPTWLFLLATFGVWLKSPSARKMISIIRPDWFANLFGSRHPYLAHSENYLRKDNSNGKLQILPLPTTKWLRLGIWHTLSFDTPQFLFDFTLKRALYNSKGFYYLMHPLDLLDPKKDLAGFPSELSGVHRLSVPIEIKEQKLRRSLEMLSKVGSFSTVSELVRDLQSSDQKHNYVTKDLDLSRI